MKSLHALNKTRSVLFFIALVAMCSIFFIALPQTVSAVPITSATLTHLAQEGSDISLSFSYEHAYELNEGLRDLSLEYSPTGEVWNEFAYLFLWLDASNDSSGSGSGGYTNLTLGDGFYRLRTKDESSNNVYSNIVKYPGDVASEQTYQYFKWDIYKKRTEADCAGTSCVQVAELELRNDSATVAWPVGSTASNPDGASPIGEEPEKLIDGNINTKWLDRNFNMTSNELYGESVIIINAGEALTFDGYRWATGNDSTDRDPATWIFYGSNDGETWNVLDMAYEEDVTTDRTTYHNISFVGGELYPFEGAGTVESPYLIDSCEALQAMKFNRGAHYELNQDIDCSSTYNWNENGSGGYYGFEPVGTTDEQFTGTLDGVNHSISGLYIHRPESDGVGLFGYTDGATVTNLSLINAHILGHNEVGGFVGYLTSGQITSVVLNNSSEGSVTCDASDDTVGHCVWARLGVDGGGIVGRMEDGTVSLATTSGPVKGSGNVIGGLIGSMEAGTLSNSSSSSNTDGGYSIGGAIGELSGGSVENISASGSATANIGEVKQGTSAGGLIGLMSGGTVETSSATGNVSADSWSAGGFVGDLQGGTITQSYATGDVVAAEERAGGFAGSMSAGAITESYATGNVNNPEATNSGGFIGILYDGSIDQSYATGDVTGTSTIGGFIGYSYDGAVTNSFARGDVVGTANTIGGFIGGNRSSIQYSYAAGTVTGGNSGDFLFSLGGFAGDNDGSIANSFAAATVTGSEYIQIGGFIGYQGATATVSQSGWWTGAHTSVGGVGVTVNSSTTSYFKDSSSSFFDLGWDFSTPIWVIDETSSPRLNAGWPYLSALVGSFVDEEAEEPTADPILGCTDPTAENYNESATEDDGSCTYPVEVPEELTINSCEELQEMNDHLNWIYTLGQDIDCSMTNPTDDDFDASGMWSDENGFVPVGGDYDNTFTGSFDGQGHVISGLYINNDGSSPTGLFGILDEDAEVHDFGLSNVRITGTDVVGSIAGEIEETASIDRVYAFGRLASSGVCGGGLVGISYGQITDSYARISVTGTGIAGGLVSCNGGLITNSYSTGVVQHAEASGGLVGDICCSASVVNSFWDIDSSRTEESIQGTGKNSTQMKNIATFTSDLTPEESWNFNIEGGTWSIDESKNDGYPYLRWQTSWPEVIDQLVVAVTGDAGDITENSATLSGHYGFPGFTIEELFGGYAFLATIFGTIDAENMEIPVTFSEESIGELVSVYPEVAMPEPEGEDIYSLVDGGLDIGAHALELTCGTTYYYRALAFAAFGDPSDVSNIELSVGDQHSFTTTSCGNEEEPSVEERPRRSSGGTSTKQHTLNQLNRYLKNADMDKLKSYVKRNSDKLERFLERGTELPPEVLKFLSPHSTDEIISSTPAPLHFPLRDLKYGMTGDDVRALQTILIKKGFSIPAGATGSFFGQTRSALTAYQLAHSIRPAIGYFGPVTRAQLKAAGTSELWW